MSDLIAIAYSDQAAAERARGHLPGRVKEGLIELEDVDVLVRGEAGTRAVRQGVGAAAGGAMWGGLIGLIFFAPLGVAVGAVAAAPSGEARSGTSALRRASSRSYSRS